MQVVELARASVQMATLFAAQSSKMAGVDPRNVPTLLGNYIRHLWRTQSELMDEICSSKALPKDAAEILTQALQDSLSQDNNI